MLSHVMSLAAPTGYLIGDGTGEMPKDSRYFVLELSLIHIYLTL